MSLSEESNTSLGQCEVHGLNVPLLELDLLDGSHILCCRQCFKEVVDKYKETAKQEGVLSDCEKRGSGV